MSMPGGDTAHHVEGFNDPRDLSAKEKEMEQKPARGSEVEQYKIPPVSPGC